MDSTTKKYRQLVVMIKGDIKKLEIDLEKQVFYKDIVNKDKIKDTKRQIWLKELEIQALEKEIEAIPRYEGPTNEAKDNVEIYCPECDYYFKDELLYCPDCGQKILWL